MLVQAIVSKGGHVAPGALLSEFENRGFQPRAVQRAIQRAFEDGQLEVDSKMRLAISKKVLQAA